MQKIVVLAKQVPDTANISGEAMKEDGTVNRAILPTIFNPEDLNALEMALAIKDKTDAHVTVITMGPPKAAEILKTSLYMGADEVLLISDRKFAGADTLATSYVLTEAIKQLGDIDIVLAGRQAIDGDTAQVGPQVAEKLDFNQITYVSKLLEVGGDYLVVERDGELQTETIKTKIPVLLTVTGETNEPRFPNCRNMLQHFRAGTLDKFSDENIELAKRNNWIIPTKGAQDLELDLTRCGLGGSPTKVSKIKNITLAGGNMQMYNADNPGIKELVNDIVKEYIEVE
ncbi:MAG: electron transfer flavoprotein subunit beta/FixA family protein [Gammaproteobacteria bacterium]|nr:electron transfer flavoprotein subunit beta/FixA family protein [Gammaproteobacteria bacterium]